MFSFLSEKKKDDRKIVDMVKRGLILATWNASGVAMWDFWS
jgi:hypothetical protein